jgi:hypothetical protein
VPDITMCRGTNCFRAESCYRHTAVADPYMQSYFTDPPLDDNGECLYYWPTETHLKGKNDDKHKDTPQAR